ncbi:hypothetical protein V6N13_108631 [Hibiscus sabdariffa]|uniref:Uncharacterized protein n=1 Tax=Hibiscus sabdariffa TaxID=183260 RepID=A0ABR2SSR8_9ROSI
MLADPYRSFEKSVIFLGTTWGLHVCCQFEVLQEDFVVVSPVCWQPLFRLGFGQGCFGSSKTDGLYKVSLPNGPLANGADDSLGARPVFFFQPHKR